MDFGLLKPRTSGDLSLPFRAFLQLHIAGPLIYIDLFRWAAWHLFLLISMLNFTAQHLAWSHSTVYSCCASGISKTPGSIRVSQPLYHPCTVCESLKGEWAAPHGGAQKASCRGCRTAKLLCFKSDWRGKTCWCCIQHRGWSCFHSTPQTSALNSNPPWQSLFHSVDLYLLARCKKREISVSIHSHNYRGIKKEGVHNKYCNSLLHGAFYYISWW